MLDWHNILEVANGVWAIVALWLTVFLIYHLLLVKSQRSISWSRMFNLPLSMQLAVGTLVVSSAIFITRTIIWLSRHANNGLLSLQATDTIAFVSGTVLGIIGFLCILRTVTRPLLGHWPWIGALLNAAAYVLWWLFTLPVS